MKRLFNCNEKTETIIYSFFNLKYFLIADRKSSNYDLALFECENLKKPVLLYYSNIPHDNKNFAKLFDRNLYWDETADRALSSKDGFLSSNKSSFYYYDSNDNIIAVLHMPTFETEHPLKANHSFFIDLRFELIMKYILAPEKYD